MRAVRFHRVGGPEVLGIDDVPDPGPPSGDEILVRVDASSVNGTDVGLRRGGLRIATVGRLPFVPGFDLTGEVLACGPRVTAFEPRERIVALLGHGGGGQAETVRIRQDRAVRAPRTGTPAHAAALPLAALTALQGLGRAGLAARSHPRVLVHGATGGIGTFALQFAVLAGAEVTAVAGAARLDLATELGAHHVIDRHGGDVAANGERYDVVLDAAGTLPYTPGLLAPGGVQVSVRPLSLDVLRAAVRPDRVRRFVAVRTAPRSQDLARIVAMVDDGRLHAVVDRVYPMTEVAMAHRHVETGVRGKVVLSWDR